MSYKDMRILRCVGKRRVGLAVALITPMVMGGTVNNTPDRLPEEMLSGWMIVNDTVMGGISQSRMKMTDEKTLVFSGNISFENNGGFASVRYNDAPFSFAGNGIVMRIKGDGKKYQFRVRTDNGFDGVAYKSTFSTIDGEWRTVKLTWTSFSATFRGRSVPGAAPLDPGSIRQIGFLISDKQEGPFRLEIKTIGIF